LCIEQWMDERIHDRNGRSPHTPKSALGIQKYCEGHKTSDSMECEHGHAAVIVVGVARRETEREGTVIVSAAGGGRDRPATQRTECGVVGELAECDRTGESDGVESGAGEGNAREASEGESEGHDGERWNRATGKKVGGSGGPCCPKPGDEAAKGTRASTLHASTLRATPNVRFAHGDGE
jgi:hypothetical protein